MNYDRFLRLLVGTLLAICLTVAVGALIILVVISVFTLSSSEYTSEDIKPVQTSEIR